MKALLYSHNWSGNDKLCTSAFRQHGISRRQPTNSHKGEPQGIFLGIPGKMLLPRLRRLVWCLIKSSFLSDLMPWLWFVDTQTVKLLGMGMWTNLGPKERPLADFVIFQCDGFIIDTINLRLWFNRRSVGTIVPQQLTMVTRCWGTWLPFGPLWSN